ncbi:hypothetical protein ACQ4PT_029953 [Festuca glaucescens]
MGSPLMASWKVSFRKVSDLDLVDSLPTDGELFVWSCSPRNWITLMDSSGAAVATRHSHEGEVIEAGSYVTFPCHVIKVGALVPSVPKVCSTTQGFISSSMRYAGVIDLEAFEAKSRANLVSNNPVSRGDLLAKKWRSTYSTTKDIDRGRMKSYDGILELDEKDQWLRLRCARGLQIGCRFLQKGDQFSIGAKLYFPIHFVRVGVPIQNCTSSRRDCMDHAASASALMMAQKSDSVGMTILAAETSVTKPVILPSTDPVVTSIAETLVLSDGPTNSGSSFRLDENSVGIALESAIGDHGGRMKVSALGDRVFSFYVSSKHVGFHILKLRMYRCLKFKCFFHLWGHGGPNWVREFASWQRECQSEWTLVSPGKKRAQLTMQAMRNPAPCPTVKTKQAEGKKLIFAHTLSYPACKGYKDPIADVQSESQQKNVVPAADGPSLTDNIQQMQSGPSEQPNILEKDLGTETLPDKQHEEQHRCLDGLEEVVDDIAYRFWECGRCLSMGHDSMSCTKRVRCRFCFRYGHFRKKCYDWFKQKNKCWVPKASLPSHIPPDTGLSAVSPPSPGCQDALNPEPEFNPPPLPLPTDLLRRSSMANFELNPAHWIRHGYHIIDGGPTRLSRSLYNVTVAPAVSHGNFYVAQLNPAPPQQDEVFWRDIIRDFIINHHQRDVESMQSCLFGVGLFELRSPTSVSALVQQQPFELDDNVFVRFIHHNNRPNHRATQGSRRGWIMVLGIPFDYRNDYDISNVVAAFGKYHHLHQDDAFKQRTMIFVTFDSLASVPRDIVFGNYANIGDVKETWTTPCYVMGADFADVLPADEDQMPLDGNPHPLPSNMAHNVQPGENIQIEEPEQNVREQPVEELVDDSIVVDLSVAEEADADMEEGEVNQPVHALQDMLGHQQMLHVGLVQIGPVLPPQMIIERLINVALPHSYFSVIPKPLNCFPIKSAFLSDQELLFKGTLSLSLGLAHGVNMPKVVLPRRRQVARLLYFDEANTAEKAQEMEPPVFTTSPMQSEIKKKRGRAKKTEPAVVDTVYGRSTRSCTKRDGHKPVSMSDTVAHPRKKGKVQKKKITEDIPAPIAETEQVADEQHEADENTVQIPPETPVHIMQRVGVAPGIDPDILTEEKLKATPTDKSSKETPNDD